jgi:tetratricopeptide (TPR) repeat protein
LPLALEQAAAYIGNKGHTFERYLRAFKERFDHLESSEVQSEKYPNTVATTWDLNFQAVEQESPVAAEVLRLSAFLPSDAIPAEIFVVGAPELGDVLAAHFHHEGEATDEWLKDRWEDALNSLVDYSLASLDKENQTHNVHRMVQAVVRHRQTQEEKERRLTGLIAVLNRIFPDPKDFRTWNLCQRLLSSVLSIDERSRDATIDLLPQARLVDQTAVFLDDNARYGEAEPLYRRALSIRESSLPEGHPDIAGSLNNLAGLLRATGRYGEAEPLYRRALSIRESSLPEGHPDIAGSLNNLAGLLRATGRYGEAEPLYRRAIKIWVSALGWEHPNTQTGITNYLLAKLIALGKIADAQTEGIKYLEEHPEEVQELLREVFVLTNKEEGR